MNKIFTILLANLLLLGCVLTAFDSASADITLAQNGRTTYVISLAADAIPSEKTAAEQLQKYLQQMTGATFALKSEIDVQANTLQILVGAGPRTRRLLPQQNWNALGRDGIIIKSVGGNLILAGGRPRGALYAVFQFLEDSVGCRWWTPGESTIPRKSTLQVAAQNVSYVSPFGYREHFTTATYLDPVFATIMRENGRFQKQEEDWGGHYNILGWSHTFMQLLPPETYFKEHPEWYSDPANECLPCTPASRMPDAAVTQLCLSNPEVVAELTKNALAWIEKNPGAGYISISQADNHNFCEDAACLALAKAEGSQSGPILNFVNKVAAGIHKKYPDFLVETLAYHGTDKPPKTIRPAKNVIVRMAPIWSDYGHPLNSDWNKETRDNLTGWAKIAPKLFVWNYVNNFDNNMVMHPNWEGLGPDLRFFAANNVKGVFQQGEAYEGNAYGINSVGDFVPLRAWLMGKLMWNPNLDQEKLTNEFLQGYYGPAGPYLKKHLDLIQSSFLAQNRKLSTYNKDFTFITLDVANESIRLFDQAEAAVKNDEALLRRVQRERLSQKIALFNRDKALRAIAQREGKAFLGPANPLAALDEVSRSAANYGVTAAFLGTQVPRLTELLAPLPEFTKDYPLGDVIDVQQHTFKLNQPGVLTANEDDPRASVGTAASTISNSGDWNIQVPVGGALDTLTDKWRVYAVVRMVPNDAAARAVAEATQTAIVPGQAFQVGIYDMTNRKKIFNDAGLEAVGITVDQMLGDDYQTLDLGIYELNSAGAIAYFQPLKNPEVSKIFVDRVILLRQK